MFLYVYFLRVTKNNDKLKDENKNENEKKVLCHWGKLIKFLLQHIFIHSIPCLFLLIYLLLQPFEIMIAACAIYVELHMENL